MLMKSAFRIKVFQHDKNGASGTKEYSFNKTFLSYLFWIKDILKHKYGSYTTEQFSNLVQENFIPIPPNHYILIGEKQLTVSSINKHGHVFTQTFNTRIISHNINMEKNSIALPNTNSKVFVLLVLEDGTLKLYEMSSLLQKKPVVRLVLSLSGNILRHHGVLQSDSHQMSSLRICLDRSFSLQHQTESSMDVQNKSVLFRFLLNSEASFYLFEVLNEHLNEVELGSEGSVNEMKTFRVEITYRIRRFTLQKPACIDFVGDTVCMVAESDMRPICYHIGIWKILSLEI